MTRRQRLIPLLCGKEEPTKRRRKRFFFKRKENRELLPFLVDWKSGSGLLRVESPLPPFERRRGCKLRMLMLFSHFLPPARSRQRHGTQTHRSDTRNGGGGYGKFSSDGLGMLRDSRLTDRMILAQRLLISWPQESATDSFLSLGCRVGGEEKMREDETRRGKSRDKDWEKVLYSHGTE